MSAREVCGLVLLLLTGTACADILGIPDCSSGKCVAGAGSDAGAGAGPLAEAGAGSDAGAGGSPTAGAAGAFAGAGCTEADAATADPPPWRFDCESSKQWWVIYGANESGESSFDWVANAGCQSSGRCPMDEVPAHGALHLDVQIDGPAQGLWVAHWLGSSPNLRKKTVRANLRLTEGLLDTFNDSTGEFGLATLLVHSGGAADDRQTKQTGGCFEQTALIDTRREWIAIELIVPDEATKSSSFCPTTELFDPSNVTRISLYIKASDHDLAWKSAQIDVDNIEIE